MAETAARREIAATRNRVVDKAGGGTHRSGTGAAQRRAPPRDRIQDDLASHANMSFLESDARQGKCKAQAGERDARPYQAKVMRPAWPIRREVGHASRVANSPLPCMRGGLRNGCAQGMIESGERSEMRSENRQPNACLCVRGESRFCLKPGLGRDASIGECESCFVFFLPENDNPKNRS